MRTTQMLYTFKRWNAVPCHTELKSAFNSLADHFYEIEFGTILVDLRQTCCAQSLPFYGLICYTVQKQHHSMFSMNITEWFVVFRTAISARAALAPLTSYKPVGRRKWIYIMEVKFSINDRTFTGNFLVKKSFFYLNSNEFFSFQWIHQSFQSIRHWTHS